MAKRKKPAYNLKSAIRSALRKVWRWSPMRRQALADARVGYGRYRCAQCKDTFGPKFIAVDHKIAATPDEADWTWDAFIARLFCPADGLQILCDFCHERKTKQEREAKKAARSGVRKKAS